ncbi:MAG: hypothetical protein JNK75_14075 [Betaproteobacteria bacterium]|nr:hypothetical protein [Betaproteobacteria bacterium]
MNRRDLLLAMPWIAATPVLAHHGWSSFDESKPVYLEGKVKSLKWQNPHAEIVVTVALDAKLPADLAKRSVPPQKASVDGARVLAAAALPTRRGDWTLELSPMTRIEAWKVPEPKAGDTVAAVGYTFKDDKGPQFARVEFLFIGSAVFALRSMPA